ncbi:hypothetical protein ACN47A_05195, partial [Myxococcus fulvus]
MFSAASSLATDSKLEVCVRRGGVVVEGPDAVRAASENSGSVESGDSGTTAGSEPSVRVRRGGGDAEASGALAAESGNAGTVKSRASAPTTDSEPAVCVRRAGDRAPEVLAVDATSSPDVWVRRVGPGVIGLEAPPGEASPEDAVPPGMARGPEVAADRGGVDRVAGPGVEGRGVDAGEAPPGGARSPAPDSPLDAFASFAEGPGVVGRVDDASGGPDTAGRIPAPTPGVVGRASSGVTAGGGTRGPEPGDSCSRHVVSSSTKEGGTWSSRPSFCKSSR